MKTSLTDISKNWHRKYIIEKLGDYYTPIMTCSVTGYGCWVIFWEGTKTKNLERAKTELKDMKEIDDDFINKKTLQKEIVFELTD